MSSLGVGVVGLSASGGWAGRSHLPALRAVDGLELRALVGSTPDRGRASARELGVRMHPHAAALAADEAVDLVVVAVKVPDHREAVLAALAAGKAIYCEWPLARDLAEARELAGAATGAKTAIGLQSRTAPAIRYLRDLLADGFVGEVLSATLTSSAGAWGPTFTARSVHELDPALGNQMTRVAGGHLLDGLAFLLGELADPLVLLANRLPRVREPQTGRVADKDAEDQMVVAGRTQTGGTVVAVHIRGGSSRVSGLTLEVNGTEGDLLVTAASGYLHLGGVRIRGARGGDAPAELPVPDSYRLVAGVEADQPAHNVAHLYRALLDDTPDVPSFAHGLERHRRLDQIETAAREASPAGQSTERETP